MDIHVHADHVKITDEGVRAVIAKALERFAERLMRVEVYLRDVNAEKGGIDKQCLLQTRPSGLDPVAVRHQAADSMEAVSGAVGKLERALEHLFGRLGDR